MSSCNEQKLWVAASEQLKEGAYLRTNIHYAGEQIAVVVFRFKDQCRAYRNLCVHMPRELDCEKDMIFDETGE